MCTRKVLTKERLDGNPVREHTAKLLEVFAEHRGMDLARENTIYCWKCGENCCSLVTNPYRRLIWRPEVSCGTEFIQRLSAHDALAEVGQSTAGFPCATWLV